MIFPQAKWNASREAHGWKNSGELLRKKQAARGRENEIQDGRR
jgi:hypothetical protein